MQRLSNAHQTLKHKHVKVHTQADNYSGNAPRPFCKLSVVPFHNFEDFHHSKVHQTSRASVSAICCNHRCERRRDNSSENNTQKQLRKAISNITGFFSPTPLFVAPPPFQPSGSETIWLYFATLLAHLDGVG